MFEKRVGGRGKETQTETERKISTIRMRDLFSAMTPSWKAFLSAKRILNLSLPPE